MVWVKITTVLLFLSLQIHLCPLINTDERRARRRKEKRREEKRREEKRRLCLRQLFCQSSSVGGKKSIQQPRDSISPSFLFFFFLFLFHAFMRSLLWIKQTPPTVTLPLAYPLACSSLYTHKHTHTHIHTLPSTGTCHIRLVTQLLYIYINLSDLLPASLQ